MALALEESSIPDIDILDSMIQLGLARVVTRLSVMLLTMELLSTVSPYLAGVVQ